MDCYCDVCDETISIKPKINIFSFTYKNLRTTIKRVKRTIKNPDFFDIEERLHDFITNYNENFDSYLVKKDFLLVFHKDFINIFKLNYDLTKQNLT